MSVSVQIDYDSVKDATRGVEDYVQRIYKDRRYQIAEAFIDIATPFVPIKDGDLRASATVVDGGYGVRWSATNPKNGYDYAGIQYNVPMNHPRGGTDHWDQEAMFYEGDTFIQKCQEILTK